MARTIAELLRQTRQTGGSVSQAVEDIGRVASTGKVGMEGPSRGNVVEQEQQRQALAQRGELLADTAFADQMRAAGMEQESLQAEGQRMGARQQFAETKQRFDLMAKDILDDLERGRARMTNREELHAIEMAGAAQRLANDKYMYELQDIARRNRLQDSMSFADALQKSVFKDEIDLFRDNVAFNELMDADDATFKKWLADIDINTALQIAAADAAAVNKRAMIGAAGTIAKEGAKFGYDYMKGGSGE